jgi:putative glutamine amidotransferase
MASIFSRGRFDQLFGRETIRVNSLHGQGVADSGDRILTEGVVEDGTLEAIGISDASRFELGV